MAKRFTDTNKYRKPFIRSLKGAYKLFWDYLYHDCDHAGIWIVDFEIAQLYIGADMPVNKIEALRLFNADEKRIVEFDNCKKWFIPSFISFQYGELNFQNRAHNSVISILSKSNLLNSYKELISPLQGAKDKDKDMDMDKEKDKLYLRPIDFLESRIEIDLEQMCMKSGMSVDDFGFCLTQWSLKCEENGWEYSADETKDLKKLRAGFEKWLGTWLQKDRKQTEQGIKKVKNNKPNASDYLNISRQAISEINQDE